MKKNWFLNVAGGAVLLTVVAVNRPFFTESTPKSDCKTTCEDANQASLAGTQLDHGSLSAVGDGFTLSGTAAQCSAACGVAVSDSISCPPIWMLLPRDPVDVFASRIQSLDAKLTVNPAQPNNVLVLNGKTFDLNKCSKVLMGPLELVEGSPDAVDSKSIPFTAYLIHNGKVVKHGVSNPDQSVLLLNMHEMLKLAQPGDELQIRPSRRSGKPLNFCVSGGC